MLKGLITAGAILLVGGLIGLLSWVSGGGFRREENAIILRYGPVFRAIGWLGVVASILTLIAMGVGVWMSAELSQGTLIAVGVMLAVFLTPAIPLLIEGYRREFRLTPVGISAKGWFKTLGPIPWNKLTKFKNDQMGQKWVFTAGKQTIKISHFMGGIDEVFEMAQQYMLPESFQAVFGKYVVPQEPKAKAKKGTRG